jgi:hypothetical protein
MTTVRRFNELGVQQWEQYVIAARTDHHAGKSVGEVPPELLTDAQWSTETDYTLPDGPVDFSDKLKIGEYFCNVIPDDQHGSARIDKMMWSWLAAKFFEQLTQQRAKIKEPRAYVASINFQDFYRHLLLGPYFIYFSSRDNPERVRVLLYDEPTTMNEVMVQFGSYQTLMQNKDLQSVVNRLYFDPKKNKSKKGSGGKGAGTPRRLMNFFKQIELNYDLRSINETDFWNMLPAEFQKFKG